MNELTTVHSEIVPIPDLAEIPCLTAKEKAIWERKLNEWVKDYLAKNYPSIEPIRVVVINRVVDYQGAYWVDDYIVISGAVLKAIQYTPTLSKGVWTGLLGHELTHYICDCLDLASDDGEIDFEHLLKEHNFPSSPTTAVEDIQSSRTMTTYKWFYGATVRTTGNTVSISPKRYRALRETKQYMGLTNPLIYLQVIKYKKVVDTQ